MGALGDVPERSWSRDGCVVSSAALANLLTGFVADWHRHRQVDAGRFKSRHSASPLAPVEWLARESGISEGTISNILHRDRSTGLLRPKNATTELRIADRLMMAIERPEVFVDGDPPSLPILPNPLASHEARAECCGGSTLLGA